MKCPHCQADLTEEVTACPRCQFHYDRLGDTFGRMPTLSAALSDMPHLLTRGESAKIRRAIKQFARRFPQLEFHVLITAVSSSEPLAKYAFWIFNGSGICSHLHKGGLNFHNLLVIDTENRRANLSVGYGLEPFISEDDLARALHAGASFLKDALYADAVMAVMAAATEIYQTRCEAIPQVYGLRRKARQDDGH